MAYQHKVVVGTMVAQADTSDVTIYHNPKCGTSRNTLDLIRAKGIEPKVIEYLKDPPSLAELTSLIKRTGGSARALVRMKESIARELNLDDPKLSAAYIINAMMMHPILINRPIVVTPMGARLCRPSESVLDILPQPQRGAFAKEDGEPVIDERGERVAGH